MRARSFIAATSACALAFLLAACAETIEREPTAVVVAIEAEPMVRAAIDSVYVEIASGSSKSDLETRAQERFDVSDGARWPLTLTLLPKSGGTDTFRIWVRAQNGRQDVSELRVISGFAPQRVLLLEVLLPDECIGFLRCDDDQTCMVDEDEGVALCGDANVAVASLVPFTDDEIERLRSDAGAPGPGPGKEDSGVPNDGGEEPAPDGGDQTEPDGGVVPNDPERCDDGDDDDGDGDVDCADDDCDARYTCSPAGDDLAILLTDTSESCPSGFEDLGVVSNDLIPGSGCGGCGCTTTQASGACLAPIYFFGSNEECNAAGADSAGTFVGYASSSACGNPIGPEENVASPFGWRVGQIVPQSAASCGATGEAQLTPARWRRERKLCRATGAVPTGGGCDEGFACVPRVETESGARCALLPEGEECVGGSGDDWYEGLRDERRCGACSCATQGGSCAAATARLGSDYVCDVGSPELAGEGERQCFGGSSIYYPPADVLGAPSAASCTAGSTTNGTIELLGGHRICCQ